jgi:hypothetical protein
VGAVTAIVSGLTALGVTGVTAAGVGTTLGAVAAVGGGLLASKALAGSPGAPPAPPTPAVAPVMNQQAVNNATQQQASLAAATSGRMSTVLSQSSGSDKLG